MMTLTNRLMACARLVPPGCVAADVGTDHGFLPVYLVKTGICPAAIASDINPSPLERARKTVQRAGLTGQISLRLCPGLRDIQPQECGAVVIAGMGGELIADILHQAPWTRQGGHALILQPMSQPEKLICFLRRQGYLVQGEYLARENKKIYRLVLARGGGEPQPEIQPEQCLVSPYLRGQPWEREYYQMLLQRYRRAARGIAAARGRALTAEEEYVLALERQLEGACKEETP